MIVFSKLIDLFLGHFDPTNVILYSTTYTGWDEQTDVSDKLRH